MTLIQQRKNTALRALFNAVTRKKIHFRLSNGFLENGTDTLTKTSSI